MHDEWGVNRLAIVTHRHYDHLGGFDGVLDMIPTDRFIGHMAGCPARIFDDQVRDALVRNQIKVEPLPVAKPQVSNIDGVRFTVLPPPPLSKWPGDENQNSIVIRMN